MIWAMKFCLDAKHDVANGTPAAKRRHEMKTKRIISAASQHMRNLRNIRGTFAAEGMTISNATRRNLDRIACGQASYQQILRELHAKYAKRG